MSENSQRIKDALSKTQLELKQLENASYEAALSGDTKKEKEIREEIKLLNGRISTLQGMALNAAPSTAETVEVPRVVNYDWSKVAPLQLEQKKPTFSYEKINYEINPNQWIIEVHNNPIQTVEQPDFDKVRELNRTLWRRKENGATIAMYEFLADNKNMFKRVLFMTDFKRLYGYEKKSYHDSLDALMYYNILHPTWRVGVGTNGGFGRIIIFDATISPDVLPKEKFNTKNEKFREVVRKIKQDYNLINA